MKRAVLWVQEKAALSLERRSNPQEGDSDGDAVIGGGQVTGRTVKRAI